MDLSISIPATLGWIEETTAGKQWLAALPDLVAQCADVWELELSRPYAGSSTSLTVRAQRAGAPFVLKVQFPDRESEREAEALRVWDGDGAIRLVAHDPARRALLLESCTPGRHLTTAGADAALDIFSELLPRLWRAPPPEVFTTLADEAARWAHQLPHQWSEAGRPFERKLVDAAVDALQELAPTQGEQVLLHQDLHPGNVLAATREPWLAIDPKPLVGEREFGIVPVIRAAELGHQRHLVIGRLDRLAGELSLDRERARSWTLAQTLAWAFENGRALPDHVETARWLHDC
jgi:streptomycin 6-kinase